jgi:clan AA aspartic protease
MIVGTIISLQGWVEIVFQLMDQDDCVVKCVVDTGFQGQLALPATTVASLGLSSGGQTWIKLADDSPLVVPVYRADILWDDQVVEVTVMAMGARALVGTELLQGFNLSADFEEDEELVLTPL